MPSAAEDTAPPGPVCAKFRFSFTPGPRKSARAQVPENMALGPSRSLVELSQNLAFLLAPSFGVEIEP